MAAPLELQDQAPGEGEGLLIVKVEDSSWDQDSGQRDDSRDSEACRQRFRRFCYRDAGGPHEAFSQLWELCCRWLRPELRTKEQILELLVLEQFLRVLPGGVQDWDVPSEEVDPETAVQRSQARGPPPTAGAQNQPPVPLEQHNHGAQLPALLTEGSTRQKMNACFDSESHGPLTFGDIPFYFSQEEWGSLDPAQRDLFWDIKRENSRNVALGLGLKSQRGRSCLEEAVRVLPGQTGSNVTVAWSPEEAEPLEPAAGARRGRPPTRRRQFRDLAAAAEKPHSCGQCGKRFRWGSDLARHQRTHTGEKPHKCQECEKSFRSSSDLVRHQGVHTGQKPFSCSECGKSFSRSAYLADHQRIHTGEKPFGCIDCGKTFSLRSYLLDHRRVHTGERPFGCGECDKSFKQRAHLIAHQSLHAKMAQPVGPRPLCPVPAIRTLPAMLIPTDFPLESHGLLRLVVAAGTGGLLCRQSRASGSPLLRHSHPDRWSLWYVTLALHQHCH